MNCRGTLRVPPVVLFIKQMWVLKFFMQDSRRGFGWDPAAPKVLGAKHMLNPAFAPF